MIFIASATMGLESVVKEECLALGFKNIKVFDGRVEFEGDFKDLVKANIYLRCSDRVFIKMAEFKALSYEELFQNVKAIEWQDFIDENGEFQGVLEYVQDIQPYREIDTDYFRGLE